MAGHAVLSLPAVAEAMAGEPGQVRVRKKAMLFCTPEEYNFIAERKKMAPRAGLEPATRWLTATCSTN